MGIVLFFVAYAVGFVYYFNVTSQKKEEGLSEKTAIESVKLSYLDLRDYPSTTIPSRVIQAKQSPTGWYIGFIQEGSDRPIISARCFFVSEDKKVTEIGAFTSGESDTVAGDFSIPECFVVPRENTINSSSCQLETCHGLDITCGSNPPNMCTEIYMLGDSCLRYAKCGVVNDVCQPTENTQFTRCKSCVETCIKNEDKTNPQKTFECERNCIQ